MHMLADQTGHRDEIIALFTAAFSAADGPEEGALIGVLVRQMLTRTPDVDLSAYSVWEDDTLLGAALFTRLAFARDPRRVVLLSPMAVATEWQGNGAGQALIRFALDDLRDKGVDVAVTYGDPAFYGRVGFRPVTTEQVAAPLPLTYPNGWIAQSLDGRALAPLVGPSACVAALDNAVYW